MDRTFLEVPSGTDLVMIPGLCEGDVGAVAATTGVRVEKGPKDLREIPQYFGRAEAAREYGAWNIEILAEVNNAPRLTPAAIRGGGVSSAHPEPMSSTSAARRGFRFRIFARRRRPRVIRDARQHRHVRPE